MINLVPGDAELVTREVLSHREFAALHFTGSTAVFDQLYRRVGENVAGYRAYPRLVGETGGKDFIVAHSSADLEALAVAIVRGGFEFQGQKCSAASRVYVRGLALELARGAARRNRCANPRRRSGGLHELHGRRDQPGRLPAYRALPCRGREGSGVSDRDGRPGP